MTPESAPLVSVAPMMAYTDRHDRYFLRLISRCVWLYTEMIHANALVMGDATHLLAFDAAEHPVALQLGGADPSVLAQAAAMGERAGFDEINLNIGCPSPRVQQGRFGACLMAEPPLVAACVAALRAAVDVPVTVKCRIGIDGRESFEELVEFVEAVAEAGASRLAVHARIAVLGGLSPKQNRSVPPLRHDVVYRLKERFPALAMQINGGIETLDDAARHLAHLDGVMIGRAAYHDPYMLAGIDRRFYGDDHTVPSRHEVVRSLLPYAAEMVEAGVPLHRITRHILGLFRNRPGGRVWRRALSEESTKPGADARVIERALACVPEGEEPLDVAV